MQSASDDPNRGGRRRKREYSYQLEGNVKQSRSSDNREGSHEGSMDNTYEDLLAELEAEPYRGGVVISARPGTPGSRNLTLAETGEKTYNQL